MTQTVISTIESRARKALDQSNIRDICHLRVDCVEDRLIISGSVSRFYYKQLAQELVLGACGEISLVNQVDVRQPNYNGLNLE